MFYFIEFDFVFWLWESKLLLLYNVIKFSGFINCADDNLSEGEASFESEFHKKYSNPSDEKKAGEKFGINLSKLF